MGQRGFSLVEMLVVVTIIGALLAIATLQFNQYTKKSGIEAQIKTMYTDIMNARAEALLQKSDRSINLTASQFSVYPNSTATDPPLLRKALGYPVISNDMSSIVSFDTRGVASTSKTVCVEPSGNPAYVDSIIITAMSIQLGKRRTGETCNSDKIDAR
jgi:prepilin-type N-terminal cleavage/methylation domain-containing protein